MSPRQEEASVTSQYPALIENETETDSRAAIATGALVLGAAAWLALGYLLFTDHGRRLRARVEPTVEAWAAELARLNDTAARARSAYLEGRDALAAMTRAAQSSAQNSRGMA
jgi:hypothetical protein